MSTETDAARRAAAEENRRKYPEAVAFVDAVRKHFPDAKVTYIGEVRESTNAKLRSATRGQ